MNLGINAKRVFTSRGAEITEIELIRDGDFLYISEGEAFEYICFLQSPLTVLVVL